MDIFKNFLEKGKCRVALFWYTCYTDAVMRTYTEKQLFNNGVPFFYTFIKDGKMKKEIHNHEFYEIFLTLTDNLLHTVGGRDYRLPQGTLVFVRPWDIHSNHNPQEPHSYIQIGFTSKVAQDLFSFLGNEYNIELMQNANPMPSFQLSKDDCTFLFRSLKKIETLNSSDNDTICKYYKNLLFHIFTDYFSKYTAKNDESDVPKWLTDTLNRIQSDKLFVDGTDAVVAASGKSYKHFARCLKKYFGKTPSEYIMDLRLSYALNLITTTNFSITDICYLCGFNSPSYFYKNFLNKYKKTPIQIRKKSHLAVFDI